MFLLRFKYRVSPIQWRAVIKVDGGAAGDVGNNELRPSEAASEGNIVRRTAATFFFYSFAVVLGQGQQAFHSVTPRVRAEITVAAALADFACDFLLCQFEEPVEGSPSPSC